MGPSVSARSPVDQYHKQMQLEDASTRLDPGRHLDNCRVCQKGRRPSNVEYLTRSMTSSSASNSSMAARLVMRLMRLRPTSGWTSWMQSVMMRCRMALLRAASFPPCSVWTLVPCCCPLQVRCLRQRGGARGKTSLSPVHFLFFLSSKNMLGVPGFGNLVSKRHLSRDESWPH